MLESDYYGATTIMFNGSFTSSCTGLVSIVIHGYTVFSSPPNVLTLGYQTSNSASSSNFHHSPLLSLLVALVLHYCDSVDLNFAILYMIIAFLPLICHYCDASNRSLSIMDQDLLGKCLQTNVIIAIWLIGATSNLNCG